MNKEIKRKETKNKINLKVLQSSSLSPGEGWGEVKQKVKYN